MADSIKIGSLDISAFKVGSSDCKIYLGDTLLYPQALSYKLVAQYSDATEYIVECDGGTALTRSMVEGHTTPKSAMTSADISGCGMPTFKVGDNSFNGATNLNSVTLNEGITQIGVQAFRDTPNLRSITFPSTLTTIGGTSFRLSGLREVSGIPSGVTYLESGTFADCTSLSAATIPASITGGSTNIFLRDTALKEVHFQGTTPPSFGAGTFNGCTGLEKIYIPSCDNYDAYAASSVFSPYTNLIYAEDSTKCRSESYPFVFKREHNGGSAYTRACDSTSATTLTSGMTRSGTSISVITGTSKQVTAITIGDCTKKVDAEAFSGWTKVANITISDSVQEIGNKAFYYCGQKVSSANCNLKLGSGITKLGYQSFYYAYCLKSLELPGKTINVTSSSTFANTAISSLTLKEGFNISGNGENMFSSCNLKNVTLPNSLTSIPKNMFYSNPITALTIGTGVRSIGNSSFYGHKINNLVIPDNVTSIGDSAFKNTDSTTYNSITIGDGCTSIGASAFTYNFDRVDIGTGITNIYTYGLYNTTCKTLICRATTPPACNTSAFGSWSKDGVSYPKIYVPDESVSAYKNASFWSTHSREIHPLSELT